MKINTKLLINIFLPIITTLIIIFIMVSSMKQRSRADEKNSLALSLLSEMSELNERTYYFLLYNEPRVKNEWFSIFDSLTKQTADIRFGTKEQDDVLERIRNNLFEMKSIVSRMMATDTGKPLKTDPSLSREMRERLAAQLLIRSRYITTDVFRLYETNTAQRRQYSSRANRLILLLLLGSLLVTVGTLVPINRTISQAISGLTAGARIIGSGNLEHRIGIKTNDEIGRLSAAFDAMTSNLKAITVSRDELAKEMAERKQTAEALKTSEENYRAIFNSASDAIFIHDIGTGAILDVNRTMLEMYKYAPEEIRNLSVGDLSARTSGYSQDYALQSLRKAAQGDPQVFEWLAKDRTGRLFWVEVNLKRVVLGGKNRLLAVVRDISGRRRVEEEFKKISRQNELILEHAGEGIFGLDLQGKVTFVNAVAAHMLGYERHELMGAPSHETWHYKKADGSSYPSSECPIYGAYTEGTTHSGEEFFNRKDGTGFPVDFTSRPLYEEDKIAGAVVIFRDITERKQAEQELRESEERFRALYEQAAVGIELIDFDGRYLRGNGNLSRMLGYSEEELQQMTFTQITHPDDLEKELALLDQLLARRIPSYSIEKRYVHKNGHEIWVRVTSSIARTSRPYRMSIIEDITERKKAETSLERSYKLTKTIIDSMNDTISLIDVRNFRIVGVNKVFLREYGYSDESEIIGRPCYEITHHRSDACTPPDDICPLAETMRTGDHFSVDHVHYDKQGERIFVEVSTSPIKDENGNVVQVVHLSRDITERKLAEEERERLLSDLARSNKELEQFAYVASHDLQEPLRMVASYVQLIERKYKGHLDEKAEKYIYFAVDGAKRMQKLIEGLLAYSRVARGAEFTRVDTDHAFSQAVLNLSVSIKESGALITKEDKLPQVSGDETQLSQLFQNLIGNAVKFRKRDVRPEVHVSVKREGKEWVFSIRDNGIGLDPEYAHRIFLIFQRLHSKDEYPGTGIGLALCKRIVERHHGRIWVESTPGKGSQFFFTIPVL